MIYLYKNQLKVLIRNNNQRVCEREYDLDVVGQRKLNPQSNHNIRIKIQLTEKLGKEIAIEPGNEVS